MASPLVLVSNLPWGAVLRSAVHLTVHSLVLQHSFFEFERLCRNAQREEMQLLQYLEGNAPGWRVEISEMEGKPLELRIFNLTKKS